MGFPEFCDGYHKLLGFGDHDHSVRRDLDSRRCCDRRHGYRSRSPIVLSCSVMSRCTQPLSVMVARLRPVEGLVRLAKTMSWLK